MTNINQILLLFSIVVVTLLIITIRLWLRNDKIKKEAERLKCEYNKIAVYQKETERIRESLEMEKQSIHSSRNKLDAEFKLKQKELNSERLRFIASSKINFEKKKNELESEYRRKDEDYNKRKDDLENEYKTLRNECLKRIERLKEISKSESLFKDVSEVYADFEVIPFDFIEWYLRTKPHPAETTAEQVKELRKKSREYVAQYKDMKYKYDFLLNIFPELKQYTEDEEQLIHLSDYGDYSDFSENRDRVHDWVPDEEYNSLTEIERNQLALNRYKESRKSNWEIGMEYEMYIGYRLRSDGYTIIQYGIENGLNDLGRDIIAEKAHLDGSRTIYIIQCKRYREDRPIHENVVCQLFGTTLEYQINKNFYNAKVIPLLVTTTVLSDTAKKFADRLGVLVKDNVKIGDYPMIKCNINNGNKIYHLPFDQQYYNTRINKHNGEKYAWTVQEAVNNGFRRAMRWRGNNSQHA